MASRYGKLVSAFSSFSSGARGDLPPKQSPNIFEFFFSKGDIFFKRSPLGVKFESGDVR
ncbi:hypothetical protein PR003_g26710 [Phytophthora rubi]|uniref:Uncharacterized protein n=1 Tax=Phytophthora rubi TaxID=129364 RepID=A0A6A3I4Q4_9STRA|nr:hypothetical protein PR002_g25714 [Phytophthora rubi]KAE8977342.1 hypothetical protein PR001_g25157 [Phytophthora rubi]KAE9284986.1 hypothetical protein PR003_g26710 [Phytophthora rubi]